MNTTIQTPFEYEVGEIVSVYTNDGYEEATVLDRMYHGSTKYYQVSGFMNPQKEAFLRKEKSEAAKMADLIWNAHTSGFINN